MLIRSAKRVVGEISVPGDKSISHRAVMLGAIAEGTTRVTNFATSADCASTVNCIGQLGVKIAKTGSSLSVAGVGKRGLRPAGAPLDCGNSGTTMRLMSGILAGQAFESTLTGDDSLLSRPMGRVIEPLALMGAAIESSEGKAPLRIHGNAILNGIRYALPVASAQVKSCTLLAGLFAEGKTIVVERTPTRDHTERLLKGFGVDVGVAAVEEGGKEISIQGDARLSAVDISVPGDISSAAFFMVAAACLPGSDLKLSRVGVNPTRSAIIELLHVLGANIQVSGEIEATGEPVADLRITGGLGSAVAGRNVVRGAVIANLIDEVPIIAVLGTQLPDGLEVRDARELRVKESDRILSVVTNLRLMNADIEEFDDGFRVGRSKLRGAEVDSFGDHRIAMAFAVAGLLAEGETVIRGAECAGVSYPEFFSDLARVVR
jgi:3-phosphoshikimate 1-carboxyvinyltransferase